MLQRQTKREQSKAETRARLMAAARKEFARKGYAGTSLRTITSQAGLTTGAFYNQFRDKEEIYLVILEELACTLRHILDEAIQDFLDAHYQQSENISTQDLLKVPLIRIFKDSIRNRDLFEILGRDGMGSSSAFAPYYLKIIQGFTRSMQKGMEQYIAAGFTRPYNTEGLAQVSVILLFAVVFYATHDRSGDLDVWAETIAAMLHGGAKELSSWSLSQAGHK